MSFEQRFTALPEHIDELGHVNNAVWVRWMEELATAHWYALASPEHHARYLWVIRRHEIDYLRPLLPGETCVGRTWVGSPKGAKFDRHFEFAGDKAHVRAITWWAILDRELGRPVRVPPEVAAPFLEASRSPG